MSQIALVRTIHPLPGKEAETIAYLKASAEARKPWGLQSMLVLRRPIRGMETLLVVWIWESRESHERWNASPERERLQREGAHLRITESDQLYEVVPIDDPAPAS